VTDLRGWVSDVYRKEECEIISDSGFDAATFLRFLRMMRTIFALVSLFTCAILMPINIISHNLYVVRSKRDTLSMLTIRDVRGGFLWAHLAMVYVITVIVIGVVWSHWYAVIEMRQQYFRSLTKRPFNLTLIVMHIPEASRDNDCVRDLLDLNQVRYSNSITAMHIGHRLGDLPRLIEVHNNTVHEFERKMLQYLKGGKFSENPQTVRIGGFLRMGGRVIDAIDHYTCVFWARLLCPRDLLHGYVNSERLKKTERDVENCRAKVRDRMCRQSQYGAYEPESYGFVSLSTVPFAHWQEVTQNLENEHPEGIKVILATDPKNIVSDFITVFMPCA
jgi:calcium permeable stress-gated cation channel